ncbi:MAG TPA: hypothetical protein VGG76_09235 [Gemmatimonadaceae bacterium]
MHHGVAVLDSAQSTNLQLQALWWKQSLDQAVSVTKTIGASGGTISIAQTGLTVVFPAGALTSPLTITITADTRYVAYKMDPAGTQFLKGVTVTQQLGTTQIQSLNLNAPIQAAYIADDSIALSGKVPVLEIEPSTTIFSTTAPLVPQSQVWIIRHFSRYMLASG